MAQIQQLTPEQMSNQIVLLSEAVKQMVTKLESVAVKTEQTADVNVKVTGVALTEAERGILLGVYCTKAGTPRKNYKGLSKIEIVSIGDTPKGLRRAVIRKWFGEQKRASHPFMFYELNRNK